MRTIEGTQQEHRAIILGDGLEGRGGLRGDMFKLRTDMGERFQKQNLILYGLLVLAAIAVPSHVKDVIAIIAKLLTGS